MTKQRLQLPPDAEKIVSMRAFVPSEPDARPPAFSDEATALRFADRHADDLRYVAAWSKWLFWDGKRWQFDLTLHHYGLARRICREAAAECNKARVAVSLASSKTVNAVVSLARSDRRLAATVEQWDANPWLLNTPAGVVDLVSGGVRDHSPDDYFTCMTAPAVGIGCPLWKAFLDRVTGGDFALQQFLQRIAGYALTGSTREHALFFLYGTGANGKSVFLETLSGILADYHETAPIETFVASHTDRHPTDVAGLRSARCVTATETEEGRRWAEAKIKQLTGGDRVSARFMRQDFFQFVPQFKLLIAGNHKPSIRSVDEAMRRRFYLVPFAITIPPKERDLTLGEQLKAEWPGILQWMIEGCAEWIEHGLAAPEAVTAATNAYLEAEDALAAWIEECCERDPDRFEKTADLFASWSEWATKAGEHVGSMKHFSQLLETRGFTPRRYKDGRGYVGLRRNPQF